MNEIRIGEFPGGAAPCFIAYVYPGWHRNSYRPDVNEWDILKTFQPYFPGHVAPLRPLDGPYDDSDPVTASAQIALAASVGIHQFMYFTYYGPQGFVMSDPMTAALEETARRESDFAIAGTWCIRLPHDRFPVPARDELDVPSPPDRAQGKALEDTPIELLTLRDLETLLGRDDPAWINITLDDGVAGTGQRNRGADTTPLPDIGTNSQCVNR